MSDTPKTVLSPIRRRALEHIRRINDGMDCSARCPHAEMILEADASMQDGQTEWKHDRFGHQGRWITEAGRSVLA